MFTTYYLILFYSSNSIMPGYSNVGKRSVYEAGDQRNVKDSEKATKERFHEGKEGSHIGTDSSQFDIIRKYDKSLILVRG